MSSVKIIGRKASIRRNGEIPVYIRIIQNRKTSFISTGVSVPLELWDENISQVRKKHPSSIRINNLINHKMVEAQDLVLDLETRHEQVQSSTVRSQVMGRGYNDLFQVGERCLRSLSKNGSIGTFKRYKTVLTKLREYHGKGNLPLNQFDVKYLKQYEEYLLHDLGNAVNTVHGNLKALRKIYQDAIHEGLIQEQHNPFRVHRLRSEPGKRGFLTEEEVNALEELVLHKKARLFHHRNVFVFACYAGGIRISDLLMLKWENIIGGHLSFQMRKTGDTRSVKLPDKAMAILKLYDNTKSKSDDFVFPYLKKGDDNDPRKLHNKISSMTAYINKELKKLAKLAKINKSISFHMSRHTFATLALRKGIRIEYVSKLLGHKDISTTQIYAKIVDTELDKAMDVFNE